MKTIISNKTKFDFEIEIENENDGGGGGGSGNWRWFMFGRRDPGGSVCTRESEVLLLSG